MRMSSAANRRALNSASMWCSGPSPATRSSSRSAIGWKRQWNASMSRVPEAERGAAHQLGLRLVHGERLLAQDVLAGLQCGDGPLGVQRDRQWVVHGIDLGVGDDVGVPVEDVLDPVLAGEGGRPRPVPGGDGDEADVVAPRGGLHQRPWSDGGRSEDPDSEGHGGSASTAGCRSPAPALGAVPSVRRPPVRRRGAAVIAVAGVEAGIVVVMVLVGGAAQSALGFGFGLLTVPVFSLIDPDLVPGPAVVFGAIALLALMVEEHGGADRGFVAWASVGRLPGSVAAGVLLSALSRSALTIVLSLLVLAGVAMSLSGWRVRGSRPTYVGAGAVSGVMGTVASIGGPPLLLTLQDRPAHELRASVAGASLIGAGMSLVVLVAFGEMGARGVGARRAAPACPARRDLRRAPRPAPLRRREPGPPHRLRLLGGRRPVVAGDEHLTAERRRGPPVSATSPRRRGVPPRRRAANPSMPPGPWRPGPRPSRPGRPS